MSRKKITIGLFGFGCVGFGLYEVLEKTTGLKAHIKKICVKSREKDRPLPPHHFTYDPQDILDDDDINVVVELIDDAGAAFEIVSAALRRGKAVVSANKKMIAEHFDELLQLQRRYHAPLLYEAAACASIPVIRNLEEYYDNDLLESLEGIVNGSTNYILTKTFSEGLTYPEALHQAQQNGFAESDPSLDTSGADARNKLVILLAHAFGLVVRPEDIFYSGIASLGDIEFTYAREKNRKIRLVAEAFRNDRGEITAFVMPKFIPPSHRLYHVDDVYNGLITQTVFADTQFFMGKGAGAHPTASAVLSDISALSYDYRYEYKKTGSVDVLAEPADIRLHLFIHHRPEDTVRIHAAFEDIHETFNNRSGAYTTGIMSLHQLKALSADPPADCAWVLFDAVRGHSEAEVDAHDLQIAEVVEAFGLVR